MLAQQCEIRGLLNMAGMPAALRDDRITFLDSMDGELAPSLRRERAGGGALSLATDADVRQLYLDAPPVFYVEGAWAIKNVMLVSTFWYRILTKTLPFVSTNLFYSEIMAATSRTRTALPVSPVGLPRKGVSCWPSIGSDHVWSSSMRNILRLIGVGPCPPDVSLPGVAVIWVGATMAGVVAPVGASVR